jgi:hypothetical protein
MRQLTLKPEAVWRPLWHIVLPCQSLLKLNDGRLKALYTSVL